MAFDPIGLQLLVSVARRRDLNEVDLTNHDYSRRLDTDFTLLPSIEMSTTDGHVLVIGPDPHERTEPRPFDPLETVELA